MKNLIYSVIALTIIFASFSIGYENGNNAGLREGYSTAKSDYETCVDELVDENERLYSGINDINQATFAYRIGYPTFDEMYEKMDIITNLLDIYDRGELVTSYP